MPITEPTSTWTLTGTLRASTRSLLLRYRRGKHSALNLIFEREMPGLRRWAHGKLPRWARGVVDTADLVQETFARAVPHMTRFEPRHEKALRAYLRSAIANQIKDELRRVHRTPPIHTLDDTTGAHSPAQPIADRPSPLESLLDDERAEQFARALAALNDIDRSAVVARLRLRYSYEQIALVLGKRSPDAARMTVTRAIERLGAHLARYADPVRD